MTAATTVKEELFRLGQHVRNRNGFAAVGTVVVEDRGRIVPSGRQVSRVRLLVPRGDGEVLGADIPATMLSDIGLSSAT